jgi:L-lactate dehydrogenase complex protein LldF
MKTYAREFKTGAKQITKDLDHRARIQKALRGYETKRDENQLRYGSYADARQAASDVKYDAINRLDECLVEFTTKLEARGAKVFWAQTAEDARDYILQIAQEKNAKALIKSKTMTSEEIHLNHALQEAGFGVVESD